MVPSACPNHPLITAHHWLDAGHKVAIATVMTTWGSAPRQPGSHLIICDDERFEGSVSGGCIEAEVITEALDAQADGRQRRLTFGVSNTMAWQAGLACGGEVEVLVTPILGQDQTSAIAEAAIALEHHHSGLLIHDLEAGGLRFAKAPANEEQKTILAGESAALSKTDPSLFIVPIIQPIDLIIIGAVHIAQKLVAFARLADFAPRIIDPRGAFSEGQSFEGVDVVDDWPDDALKARPPGARSALVTLTHDPKLDDAALQVGLTSDAFYIGSLGSRKTHAARLERLKAVGFDDTALARIHGPVGLALGARTPTEIALSILAQITAVRRGATP